METNNHDTNNTPQQRHVFSAILFTDLAMFSHLHDNECYQAIDASIQRFVRAIKDAVYYVNTWGDGIVICASTPSQALDIAERYRQHIRNADFQNALNHRIQPRIGLHFGLITINDETGTLSGDDVNFAARIEPCAEPDTIFCSLDFLIMAYKESNKHQYVFVPRGHHALKNNGSHVLFMVKPDNAHLMTASVISLISQLIAYNQGNITRLWLKIRLLRESANQESMHTLATACEYISAVEIAEAAQANINYLAQFFSLRINDKRTPNLPRICLKAHDVSSGKVYDLKRNEQDQIFSPDSTPLISQSAIQYCLATGLSFTCNDIPHDAAHQRYLNPRLSAHRVQAIKEAIITGQYALDDWYRCWTDYTGEATQDSRAFYRSTAIIPLAIRSVNGEAGTTEIQKIYGFLCMDHHDPHYFDALDHKMAFVMADILTQYLVIEAEYTRLNTTNATNSHPE